MAHFGIVFSLETLYDVLNTVQCFLLKRFLYTYQELKYLTRKMLEYKAVDYDMDYIMFQQNEMHDHFKEKTKELGIDIC